MQAIPGFGGFYHPAFAALHRTASQLISQSEAARKVPNFCAAQICIRNLRLSKSPLLHLAGFCLIRGPINFELEVPSSFFFITSVI